MLYEFSHEYFVDNPSSKLEYLNFFLNLLSLSLSLVSLLTPLENHREKR